MTDLDPLGRRPRGRNAAAALVLATVLTELVGATAPLPGLLALGAAAAAGCRLVSHRRRGGLDALLVGVGGSLIGVIGTGVALSLTGLGLRPATWTIGMAALAVVSLMADLVQSSGKPPTSSAHERPRRTGSRHPLVRAAPWVVASAIVLAVAVGVSVRSLSATDEPPLAMSLDSVDGTAVHVVVNNDKPSGRLELRAAGKGTHLTHRVFRVGEDGSWTTTLTLPRHGRFTITLNHPGQTRPLRTLILDR